MLECIKFEEKPSSVSLELISKTGSNQSDQTNYMILRCAGIIPIIQHMHDCPCRELDHPYHACQRRVLTGVTSIETGHFSSGTKSCCSSGTIRPHTLTDNKLSTILFKNGNNASIIILAH